MPAEVTDAQTPLMRQYQAAKRQHPDALLLFRLGDFYELFYQDAVTAAPILQITLTARNKEKGEPIPMCGVPYHAAESYIGRLVARGFKVALCEQMEDPKLAKTLVRREVTRVVTPGTAAFQLEEGEQNYLAAVARTGDGATGLAVLDVSTGEFRATEFRGPDSDARLAEELARWHPRELLHAAGAAGDAPLFRGPRPEELATATITPLDAWIFEPGYARGVLESHFGVLTLEGFGLAGAALASSAAGAIVHYVKETQRSQLAHVDRLGFYERQQGLVLDATTVRNLDLDELRGVLDATVTPMGKRLLRQWLLRPSGDAQEIARRHQIVADWRSDWPTRQAVRKAASGIQDLERLLGRIALETALPRDLLALGASLDRVPELAQLTAGRWGLDDCPALRASIAATLDSEGNIRAGVHSELDEVRALSHNAKGAIAAIEDRERGRTSIASLKVRFNNIFGYYIEVSKPNLRLVPADYERKQTLVNAERFTTPELKELERKILSADERARALELELFAALRASATASTAAIRQTAAAVAELDLLANFAHIAENNDYCRPEMGGEALEVHAGRHPVVERARAGAETERFVPNDVALDPARRVLLITGPNMGGKSTYLRQVALMAIMAQMGGFVAAQSAKLPLFDRIFTRIGASDNLARGRSTFMVEMTEAAVILNQATPRSLVLLDEIGRGTSTYDGLSLAWAIVEYLEAHNQCLVLFATHYHELTELAAHLPAVHNAHVTVRETPHGVAFLRRVEPGEASRSYGIEVARLAGLPREVVDRAREVMAVHERGEPGEDGGALAAVAPEAEARLQLTLFTPLSQQIVDRLAACDLNQLTPLEALNLLADLKRQMALG